jgi:hypothetical protein
MKKTLKYSVGLLVVLSASVAWAQTAVRLQPPPAEYPNRIGLSYRMGLNITVDFKRLGGFAPLSDPGPDTGTAEERFYDDGYNRVDISGNQGGQTWFWGYENPESLQGETMFMTSSSAPATGVSKNRGGDELQHGFEILYMRELYREEKWRAGLESAFGYTRLSIDDSRTVFTQVDRITDMFFVPGGVFVVPAAPYEGTFEGPGPLMSSDPDRIRTVLPNTSFATGRRELEADVFMFRLGPYVEVPMGEKWAAIFSGGLTLVVGDIDLSYRETVTIPDVGTTTRAASRSQNDFLVGGYVGGSLAYAVTERVNLFAGVQFQAAGRSVTTSRATGDDPFTRKRAVLDLGETVLISVGATYAF